MKHVEQNRTVAWLMDVIRGKRRYIVLLALLQAAQGISSIGYAVFLRDIIDSAVVGNQHGVNTYALCLIGLVAFQVAVRCAFRFVDEYSRAVMDIALKRRVFSSLLVGDYAKVSAVHSGEWINRLSSDVGVVSAGLSQILPGFVGTFVRMSTALLALLALEPRFGIVIVIGGACIVVITFGLRKKLKQRHAQMQAADGVVKVYFTERLGSLMTIRAFGKEAAAMEQVQEKMDIHKTARMKKNNLSNVSNTGLNIATNGAYALGAIYCGFQILAGSMSYGTFTAVLQLVSQAQAPIVSISGFLPRYYSMIASADRLMEADLFRKDETEPATEDVKRFYREHFRGLQLRNVSFSYTRETESREVLRNLDLTIEKGQYVAFTGPSGCGKSTVLKLLMCMYPLEDGQRFVLSDEGDQPLHAGWRQLFAYVPQGNQLMNGTIREVVTFGDVQAMEREADIFRALRVACAEEFVRQLPDGLDTMLGERGGGLSEGQMQRIAIARAIFSQRPVLLLDEATSALDEQTEKAVLRNLQAMTDQTVIIVTHRVAVLEVTDREVRFSTAKEPEAVQTCEE